MIHEVSMGKWREELKEFWYQRAGTSGIINSSAPYDQVPYSILVSMTKTALAHSEISGSLHSIKSWYDEDPSRVNILSDELSYPHKDEKNFGDFVH